MKIKYQDHTSACTALSSTVMRHCRFSRCQASVGSLTVVLLAMMFSAQHALSAEPLKIKASLSGYNLIWPTIRCCAFDLALQASGKGMVTIHDKRGGEPRDQAVEINLTASQIDELFRVIASNEYFSLPASVGDMPIDDDVRRMEIQIGSRTHKVELNGWPIAQQTLDSYDIEKRAQIARAAAVWVAIRQLVSAPHVSLP